MANAWGELDWGTGYWGQQIINVDAAVTGSRLNLSVGQVIGGTRIDVPVTGSQLNVSIGNETATADVSVTVTTAGRLNTNIGTVTVEAIIGEGWGGDAWGLGNWGQGYTDITVNVTGRQLNVSEGSATIVPSKEVDVTGSRINVNVGSVTNTAEASVNVTTPAQYATYGAVDINADGNESVNIEDEKHLHVMTGTPLIITDVSFLVTTAGRLNISEGNVDTNAEATVNVTGSQLNTNVGQVEAFQNTPVDVTGSQINISEGNVTFSLGCTVFATTAGRLDTDVGYVDITADGNQTINAGPEHRLNVFEGNTTQSANANVNVTTAGRLNIAIGNTTEFAGATVNVTGSQINVSVGQITYEAGYNVTGSQANLSVGTVFIVLSPNIAVTGSRLNVIEGNVNIRAWQQVVTGVNNVWTPVDIAA